MVLTNVGDDGDVRPHHVLLRILLVERANRHAFDDERLDVLPDVLGDDVDLLVDVRCAAAEDRGLLATGPDHSCRTARRLRDGDVAAFAQDAGHEPRHRGLAANTVDVHAHVELPQTTLMRANRDAPVQQQRDADQRQEGEREERPRHARTSPPSAVLARRSIAAASSVVSLFAVCSMYTV